VAAAIASRQELIDEFVGAAHGDLRRVKQLLASHSSLINVRASWGETALAAAAHVGHRDVAEFLLSVGAPLDVCTAAMLGLHRRLAQLLRLDPSLADARGAHGLPALYHAAIGGHVQVAELLREAGADLATAATSALFGAVRANQAAIVAWLLVQGAEVNALGADGLTPQALARQLGHSHIADLLARHGARAESSPAPTGLDALPAG
jgi:ankyrin repeat protein